MEKKYLYHYCGQVPCANGQVGKFSAVEELDCQISTKAEYITLLELIAEKIEKPIDAFTLTSISLLNP